MVATSAACAQRLLRSLASSACRAQTPNNDAIREVKETKEERGTTKTHCGKCRRKSWKSPQSFGFDARISFCGLATYGHFQLHATPLQTLPQKQPAAAPCGLRKNIFLFNKAGVSRNLFILSLLLFILWELWSKQGSHACKKRFFSVDRSSSAHIHTRTTDSHKVLRALRLEKEENRWNCQFSTLVTVLGLGVEIRSLGVLFFVLD